MHISIFVAYRQDSRPQFNTDYRSLEECQYACVNEVPRCNAVNFAPAEVAASADSDGNRGCVLPVNSLFSSQDEYVQNAFTSMCAALNCQRGLANFILATGRKGTDSSGVKILIRTSTVGRLLRPEDRRPLGRPGTSMSPAEEEVKDQVSNILKDAPSATVPLIMLCAAFCSVFDSDLFCPGAWTLLRNVTQAKVECEHLNTG